MSWVSDSTELVSGGWLASGYAGHGILGSAIPAVGDNGGSPVLNDGVAPASEYRWELVTPPSAGTLTINEDLTFEFSYTSDIITTFVYRLYEDGVVAGTATVNVQIGPSHTVIAITTQGVAGSLNSHSSITSSCVINATTGRVVCHVDSASGVSASLIDTITQGVSGAVASIGYVPTGMTLSPEDLVTIVAAVMSAIRNADPPIPVTVIDPASTAKRPYIKA